MTMTACRVLRAGLATAFAVLLSCAAARADATLAPLPVSTDEAVAAAISTGLLADGDFAAVDDPYVGRLRVGRPTAQDGAAVSVLLFDGPGGLEQIQIILDKPWGDLPAKLELVGAMLRLLVTVPEPNAIVAQAASFHDLSQEAQWAIGLLSESWAGWPGTPTRQVRDLGGIAVIAEGYPPDYWVLTLAVDDDYPDVNWPGPDPAGEAPAIAEARLAVRAGDYERAHQLLRGDEFKADPAAQTMLGDMFRFARLGRTDQQTASDYYLRAGRVQYPAAVYALATMANVGYGVLTFDGVRYPLLEVAAARGSADALFVLSAQEEGVFYQRPEGVEPVDQVRAAAMLGLVAAQVDLSNRYLRGEGIEADPVAAYAWALVAVAQTDPGIDWIRNREIADQAKAGLSGKQIADAHALADDLLAQIGN